jgi:carboxypeptidase C (cathepsin A)
MTRTASVAFRFVLPLLLALSAPALVAQERAASQVSSAGVLRLLPADAVTDKEIVIGGRALAYTATAGTLSLFDQSGERIAAIFYTAYVAKGSDTARRPVTFVFNGGPGAASVFLNLGLAGPRLLDFGPDGRDGAAA